MKVKSLIVRYELILKVAVDLFCGSWSELITNGAKCEQ